MKNNRMPGQQHEKQLLRKRAISLASKVLQENMDNSQMFLHVQLSQNEHYGIPYRFIDEISRPRPITLVPGAPGIIAGVIPYHSQLIAVLDLSQMLKLPLADNIDRLKNSWLAMVSVEDMKFALLIDEVCGNNSYYPEELDQSLGSHVPGESTVTQNDPVDGIYKGKIAILDLSILVKNYYLNAGENK